MHCLHSAARHLNAYTSSSIHDKDPITHVYKLCPLAPLGSFEIEGSI